MRKYASLAAALLLAAASPASAAEPVDSPDIAAYLAVAEQYWHAPPPCPIVVVRDQLLPDPRLWASTSTSDCMIALDPDFYPRPPVLNAGYWHAEMCSVITHEYGHLLGYQHTTDPRSVMNPVTPLNVVPGCPWWQNDMPGRRVQLRRRREHSASTVRWLGWSRNAQVTRRVRQRRLNVVDAAVRAGAKDAP